MGSVRPVIDQRAAEQMNLNVLRRIDPQVEEVTAAVVTAAYIVFSRGPYVKPLTGSGYLCPVLLQLLATAGHVALYDFDIPTKRWSRKDVEGSLFLVKRRSQPRFQFVILNKKSAVGTDNFVEDVHGGFQCEVQKPYVLYRNRANEVVGIWFYDDADCDRISALLQRIASTFAAPSEAGAGAAGAVAAPSADDSAAPKGGAPQAGVGDDSFWDRQVAVPEKGSGTSLPLPAPAPNGQAAPQAVPQLQPQAAAQASAPANNNDIARLFAGIKVSSGTVPAPAVAPEAADRALRSKVSSLLSSLASNEAFCGILAAELKKAGLV
ncbi:hypothetical protein ABPG77_000930 [Micractinium sp. CCAP 211/92]